MPKTKANPKAKQAKAAPTASRVRKASKASKPKDKEGFTSVAGVHYESKDAYREAKSKHPNSRYMILLAIVNKLTGKGIKQATIKIADEKTLKEKHFHYVADTLPNAVLDLAENGDSYSVRNRVIKEMPKMDKNGKPNGNTAKKGLVQFDLIKV
jgi:hypothetical protein